MTLMTLIQTFLAGLVGTAGMSLTMGAITRMGWANADMIRAVGSLVTRKREGAFGAGLVIHFLAGMLFAIPYTFVLSRFGSGGILMTLGLGLLMGLAHGIVMAIGLLTVGSREHPLEEFRGVNFQVAVAHVFGHMVYGVGVALVVEVLGITWGR